MNQFYLAGKLTVIVDNEVEGRLFQEVLVQHLVYIRPSHVKAAKLYSVLRLPLLDIRYGSASLRKKYIPKLVLQIAAFRLSAYMLAEIGLLVVGVISVRFVVISTSKAP